MALPRVLVACARAPKPRGTVSEWLRCWGNSRAWSGLEGVAGKACAFTQLQVTCVVTYKWHRQVVRAFKGHWDSNNDRSPRLILLTGFFLTTVPT